MRGGFGHLHLRGLEPAASNEPIAFIDGIISYWPYPGIFLAQTECSNGIQMGKNAILSYVPVFIDWLQERCPQIIFTLSLPLRGRLRERINQDVEQAGNAQGANECRAGAGGGDDDTPLTKK